VPGLAIDQHDVQTNMVFARVTKGTRQALTEKMANEGVLVSGRQDWLRFVTHYDFKPEFIEPVVAAFLRAFEST